MFSHFASFSEEHTVEHRADQWVRDLVLLPPIGFPQVEDAVRVGFITCHAPRQRVQPRPASV